MFYGHFIVICTTIFLTGKEHICNAIKTMQHVLEEKGNKGLKNDVHPAALQKGFKKKRQFGILKSQCRMSLKSQFFFLVLFVFRTNTI